MSDTRQSRSCGKADVLALAARGDIEAQEEMLKRLVKAATQPGPITEDSIVVIEIWARMLATHGRVQDAMRLGGVLVWKGAALQFCGKHEAAEPILKDGMRCFREAFERGYEPAEAQRAELSRRLVMGITIPAEVMLGDLAPTVQ